MMLQRIGVPKEVLGETLRKNGHKIIAVIMVPVRTNNCPIHGNVWINNVGEL